MGKWTAADMPPLGGKVAVVTGASSGIGLETAAALAAAGAETVIGCRNAGRAAQAIEQIRARHPQAKISNLELDVANLASVRRFAATFSAQYPRLDILCNNAGAMTLPFSKTVDGFEVIFGTNHLGPFALTGLLLDSLCKTPGARVVALGSLTHRRGTLRLDDLLWERRSYSKSGAYAQSKLANMLFAFELDRRLKQAGINAVSLAAHPGYAATNIVYGGSVHGPDRIWNAMAGMGNALAAQPAAMGALPTVYAATAPGLVGGEYIGPDGFMQLKGHPTVVSCSAKARDAQLAKDLWDVSEKLTGVSFLS